MLARLIAPVLRTILALLEKAFETTRQKSTPPFPYDKNTNTITLPPDVEREVLQLVWAGNKVEAVKKATRLTGAGLRVSKDYVDNLAKIS